MSATPITLPAPAHPDTLLLASADFDPDEAPYGVADNVWADRYFWVHQTVERYYEKLAWTDSATWPALRQHGELIVGEMAEVLFGSGAAEDPKCREAAWDVIVVVALEWSARLAIRLDRSVVVTCDSPEEKWDFNESCLADYVARLTSGDWPNEYDRRCGERGAQ